MIRASSTGAGVNRGRRARLAAAATVAAVALVAAACSESDGSVDPVDDPTTSLVEGSDSDPGTGSTITVTTTTTTTTTAAESPTLEERIVANMQGAQLHYQNSAVERYDGAGDALGIVFFHRGNWASQSIKWPPESDSHCERATYTWSVVDAASESDFTILYDELTEDPDCLVYPITRITVVFSGMREVDGRTVYDYTESFGPDTESSTGSRIVCSSDWTEPEPCGLALSGFEMSTPPES
jgi:hypothetical protein